MRLPVRLLTVLVFGLLGAGGAQAQDLVQDRASAGAVPLFAQGRVADVRIASAGAPVVTIAAGDLVGDLEAVTGARPRRLDDGAAPSPVEIWVGVLGQDPRIDRLAARGRLDARGLKGAWESFVIAPVQNPAPGVRRALVIVGSDPRGAAFGVYELSQAIGVSPWSWWADVPVQRRSALHVPAGARRFGPPSVKYRGIFINDEDWGLHPWASRTFDPELGDIGPKTYAKVFELLLRLKANTLWPAMHEVTGAFNSRPENRALADRYAIVMGSSHAEPMLRNNVREWTQGAAAFDYSKNPLGIQQYWEERVRENAGSENIYTLGIRGIHDSGMAGPESVEGKRALLEQVFADQRALLARHVDAKVERVPQAFTAYKEVLDIYDAGLKVPEDVTLVWPDDNHGYIRRLPNAAERARPGGSGVYYHLSYLGAPLSYLWLSTTPPALIWEEMGKAYDHGARTLWIANVGDIKPAEIATDFFLQMAWDRDRWTAETLPLFFEDWSARQFGPQHAPAIGRVLERHHALNFERRPEHLQWHLPGERYRPSPWTAADAQRRMDAFDALAAEVAALETAIPAGQRDAFFQLVAYPVWGAALANARLLHNEAYRRLFNSDPPAARAHGAAAIHADGELKALTRRFNTEIAGGKWRHIMAEEPADTNWPSYRLTPPVLPAPGLVADAAPGARPRFGAPAAPPAGLTLEAEAFTASTPGGASRWSVVPGLGRGGGSVSLAPSTLQPDLKAPPRLDYRVRVDRPGDWRLRLDLLPTFPLPDSGGLRLAVSLDGGERREVRLQRTVGERRWACEVLDARASAVVALPVSAAGERTLSVYGLAPGVVLDRIALIPPGTASPDLGCAQ